MLWFVANWADEWTVATVVEQKHVRRRTNRRKQKQHGKKMGKEKDGGRRKEKLEEVRKWWEGGKQLERLQVTRQVCSAYLSRNRVSSRELTKCTILLERIQCELLYITQDRTHTHTPAVHTLKCFSRLDKDSKTFIRTLKLLDLFKVQRYRKMLVLWLQINFTDSRGDTFCALTQLCILCVCVCVYDTGLLRLLFSLSNSWIAELDEEKMRRSTSKSLLCPAAEFITTPFPQMYYSCFFTACLVHVLAKLVFQHGLCSPPAVSNCSHLCFLFPPLPLFPASSSSLYSKVSLRTATQSRTFSVLRKPTDSSTAKLTHDELSNFHLSGTIRLWGHFLF